MLLRIIDHKRADEAGAKADPTFFLQGTAGIIIGKPSWRQVNVGGTASASFVCSTLSMQ